MKLLKTIILILIATQSIGQINEFQYFSDTLSGNIDFVFHSKEVNDGIIISAKKIGMNSEEPLLLKISVSGDIIWTTLNSTSLDYYDCRDFTFEIFGDGYIYGYSYDYVWPDLIKTIWKVDSETGVIIWTKPFYPTDYSQVNIVDYDSVSFLATYSTQTQSILSFVDKATGDTTLSKNFGPNSDDLNIAVDYNNNIYFSRNETLTKFNLDNLEEVIWSHEYHGSNNDLDIITRIYLDRYDDIYLFGTDIIGGGQDAIIKRISNLTGEEDWSVKSSVLDVKIIDFVDFQNELYVTYKHILAGGGSYYFSTVKVNKLYGTLSWTSYLDVDPLGSPASYSGGGQSALSIDTDCYGHVYLTGYYGDSGYGPAAWGIMKLNGYNGTKIYDLTITEDSTTWDNLSSGRSVFVFGNSPVIIGNVEYAPWETKSVYISIDPVTGDIIKRKDIGAKIQNSSQTIDIVNQNDSIYILKQFGSRVLIEQYDTLGTLLWEQIFADSIMLYGGQIVVVNDFVYLSTYNAVSDSFAPYYSNLTDKMELFKISKINGDILQSDSLLYFPTLVRPFELEADNDNVYLFYTYSDSLFFRKWDSIGFSSEFFLDNISDNINFDGKLNIIQNESSSSLLALGNNHIYRINKTTLSKNSIFNYAGTRSYYDMNFIGDTLYLCGKDSVNNQVITCVDMTSLMMKWEQYYSNSGTLYKIANSSDKLYAAGSGNSLMQVYQISSTDGSVNWHYELDEQTYGVSELYDFEFLEENNCMALTGAKINTIENYDLIISIIDIYGEPLHTHIGIDELNEKSVANTVSFQDTSFWIGGSINRITQSKEGFIYQISISADTISGIDGVYNELNVLVYPNPSSGSINLSGIKNGPFSYSILDVLGKKLINEIGILNRNIAISNFSNGIYLLRIEQNRKVYFVKFIKN